MGTAISATRDGHVLRITLTRADRRNAFDGSMVDIELSQADLDASALTLEGLPAIA